VGEALKWIVRHGDSLERIRSFPSNARQDAGVGVVEIRVHAGGGYRVFYVAKFKDAVHVPHAFVKKTQKPRRADIELAAKRYREAVEEQIMARRQPAESDNVFQQLGFKREEALNLRLRSEMMNALIAEIEKKGLTQAQAAAQLGVSQPRISDLMRGKLHLFSIDTLVTLLSAAGLRVEMKVRRAA
jgi:predicted XRE-type DNA-binding protein/phage-related protein